MCKRGTYLTLPLLLHVLPRPTPGRPSRLPPLLPCTSYAPPAIQPARAPQPLVLSLLGRCDDAARAAAGTRAAWGATFFWLLHAPPFCFAAFPPFFLEGAQYYALPARRVSRHVTRRLARRFLSAWHGLGGGQPSVRHLQRHSFPPRTDPRAPAQHNRRSASHRPATSSSSSVPCPVTRAGAAALLDRLPRHRCLRRHAFPG